MRREIVLDTETTGTDAQNDRVIEIGCVEIHDGIKTGRTYHTYLNPSPRRVQPGAFGVHGLSDQFLSGHPKFAQVVDAFLEFIGNDQLVIHNAPFDVGFLNAELQRLSRKPLDNPIHDTLAHARRVKKGGRHNLDTLSRHYGVDVTHRTKHGALLDAEILVDVYFALQGGQQRSLELLPTAAPDTAAQHREGTVNLGRKSPLTPQVLEAHLQFVSEAIGPKAIWHSYDLSSTA